MTSIQYICSILIIVCSIINAVSYFKNEENLVGIIFSFCSFAMLGVMIASFFIK